MADVQWIAVYIIISAARYVTLVLACCKANRWSNRKMVNFVQPQSAHPSTNRNQNLQRWLRKWRPQLRQIWSRSHYPGPSYGCVKYNPFVRFYSIFSFPFLFLSSPTAQTPQPILTVDGSNDAVWRKDVPFGGRIYCKQILGGNNPLKLPLKRPRWANPSQNVNVS